MIKVILLLSALLSLAFSSGRLYAQTTIDDVSRLNETTVSTIRQPASEEDIQQAVRDALVSGKNISIAGKRHSQGGHIMADDAVVLDMTAFNRILSLDTESNLLTVQSGTTWEQIQDFLNEKDLAVKVQQSSNIFTVGGSLSANIHGRDPRFGPIIETVSSFRLVKADGEVANVSRSENPELFSLVIGGYGLFGIITNVDLEVVPNSVLKKTTQKMKCRDYPKYLASDVLGNEKDELHYVRPDITTKNFMDDCSVTSFIRIAEKPETLEPLEQEKLIETSRWLLDLSRKSKWGKNTRWFMQENFLDIPGKAEVITRNNAMRPPVQFLEYQSPTDTDILQEYFIPISSATAFMDDLENIFFEEDINVLSITLRAVKADKESFLPYATEDMLAFVLYINHGRDNASVEQAKEWTRKLIDAALRHKGTYYLTYANYATPKQKSKAYPALNDFLDRKAHYDPAGLFSNKFYKAYR